MAKHCK